MKAGTKLRVLLVGLLAIACLMVGGKAMGESVDSKRFVDLYCDTWRATDALGRHVPTAEEVGPPRKDRFVGIFYFLWLGMHDTDGPFDISRILEAYPEAMRQPTSPPWGPLYHFHYWGEPLFGYYRSDDEWVLTKHAVLLEAAGVDTVIFDVTNQATYRQSYLALLKTWARLRSLGQHTPQVAFLCPFWDPHKVVDELYRELYEPKLYPELWFYWKGKPLILADPAKVSPQVRDFFTFRKPVASYFTGPDAPEEWSWLEVFPQHVFYDKAGQPEQMSVGVAQNAVDGRLGSMSEARAQGRSFHNGTFDNSPGAVNYGYNFAEQFERALEVDPEFIFVTGWNEWIAMRLDEFAGVKEPVMFVDTFDQEHSRDLEPMKGGHGDNYYYQLVSFVRRYKGARPQRPLGAPRTINLAGSFDQWRKVEPVYRDAPGDCLVRDHLAAGKLGRYTDTSARNDLMESRIAYDDEYLYFYLRTRDAITPFAPNYWLTLYLNTDCDASTGWEGYDYVLNRKVLDASHTLLEQSKGGWNWEPVATLEYRVEDKEFMVKVLRKALGLEPAKGPLRFEFKWHDNGQRPGDVYDFYLSGDAAPEGRFNYYCYESSNP